MNLAVVDRLIESLESARSRKEMFFTTIDPSAVVNYLNGLRWGLSICGIEWSFSHREPIVESRGIEFRCAAWETEALQERGLSAEQIVDELLAIEIEMWRSQRDAIPILDL